MNNKRPRQEERARFIDRCARELGIKSDTWSKKLREGFDQGERYTSHIVTFQFKADRSKFYLYVLAHGQSVQQVGSNQVEIF